MISFEWAQREVTKDIVPSVLVAAPLKRVVLTDERAPVAVLKARSARPVSMEVEKP